MEYTNEIRLSGRAGSAPTEQEMGGDIYIQFPLSNNETVLTDDNTEAFIRTHWFRIITKDKALSDKIRNLKISTGDDVLVKGSLAQDNYKDAEGIERPGITINVKDVQILRKVKRSTAHG